MKQNKKKKQKLEAPEASSDEVQALSRPQLRELDDVVSMGVLLRPSIDKALKDVSDVKTKWVMEILLNCERSLSNHSIDLLDRMRLAHDEFGKLVVVSPAWRFLEFRLADLLALPDLVGIREFSSYSLMIGALLEGLSQSNKMAFTKR